MKGRIIYPAVIVRLIFVKSILPQWQCSAAFCLTGRVTGKTIVFPTNVSINNSGMVISNAGVMRTIGSALKDGGGERKRLIGKVIKFIAREECREKTGSSIFRSHGSGDPAIKEAITLRVFQTRRNNGTG